MWQQRRHGLCTNVFTFWSHRINMLFVNTHYYYLNRIIEDLSLKQRQNPQYSLRAYARDMDMHPSTMSKIIKGQRPLPLKDSAKFIERLNLGPKEKTLFMESLMLTKVSLSQIKVSPIDERFMLDESHDKVISEWEHYALMELFNIKGFVCTPDEVSRRLGITIIRATAVINNMTHLEILTIDESGDLVRTHRSLRTTEDVKSTSLRKAHKETLELAKVKLEEVEVELRDFSATTVALDPKKLPEAKAIIREFRLKMAELLRDGERTEVYRMAVQLFPLTPTDNENKQKGLLQ